MNCKKKPGGLRNVTDQWCEENCMGGLHPACMPSSGVQQTCVCNGDSTIIPTGVAVFKLIIISHRNLSNTSNVVIPYSHFILKDFISTPKHFCHPNAKIHRNFLF